MKSDEHIFQMHILFLKSNAFYFILYAANRVIQKEVVHFRLSKQEVALLQRPSGEDTTSFFHLTLTPHCTPMKYVSHVLFLVVGRRGARGHFYRHRVQRLLG